MEKQGRGVEPPPAPPLLECGAAVANSEGGSGEDNEGRVAGPNDGAPPNLIGNSRAWLTHMNSLGHDEGQEAAGTSSPSTVTPKKLPVSPALANIFAEDEGGGSLEGSDPSRPHVSSSTEATERLSRQSGEDRRTSTMDESFGEYEVLPVSDGFFAKSPGELDVQLSPRSGEVFKKYDAAPPASHCRLEDRGNVAIYRKGNGGSGTVPTMRERDWSGESSKDGSVQPMRERDWSNTSREGPFRPRNGSNASLDSTNSDGFGMGCAGYRHGFRPRQSSGKMRSRESTADSFGGDLSFDGDEGECANSGGCISRTITTDSAHARGP